MEKVAYTAVFLVLILLDAERREDRRNAYEDCIADAQQQLTNQILFKKLILLCRKTRDEG